MSIFREPINYIYFHNTTYLPIQVSRWIKGSNTLKTTRIGPNEKQLLHSSVGEWHMDSMFSDDADCEIWKNAGLEKHHIIGKFRSRPCIQGEYSWMEYYEPFHCIYSKIEDGETGLITLIKK
jgi:hypothetical protein